MDWSDDRGQALQVGAVLLLGILVIGLSIYQVTVVPQENREVEFNSYLDASTDMSDLRNDVLASAQRGVQSGTTVETGTTYPARALFVNPPPASGRLDALDARDVTVEGVEAVGSEPANVEAVWNGSARDYPTRAIRFSPGYARLEASPVVADGGSVYRVTDNGPIPLAGQSLVDGNRITLVTVGGNLSTGGLASTVTTEPVSTSQRTVTVTGEGGSDFTVTLRFPSAADAAAWNDSRIAGDYRNQPRVTGTNHPAGQPFVEVSFDGDETYELRIARVTVHEADEEVVESEPDPEYVIPVAGNNSTVQEDTNVTLSVEVRDRYNNPVSGTDVTFTSGGGNFSDSSSRTVTTTADGRATVEFNASTTGTTTVTASFTRATSFNETTFELDVDSSNGDGGNTGGNINPNDTNAVVLNQASISSGNAVAEFDTRGSDARTVTELRVNFYYEQRQGQGQGGQQANFEQYDIDNLDAAGEDIDDLDIGAGFTDPDPNYLIQASGQTRIEFNFNGGSVQIGDFFVFSVNFENGESATYFIAPT
jgi:hypothetical protein